MIDSNGFLRCKCGKALGRDLKGNVAIVCPKCKRLNQFKVLTDLTDSVIMKAQ